MRWTIDGYELPRNPSAFAPQFVKNIIYEELVTGGQTRHVPDGIKVSMAYEAEWVYIDEDLRNFLHDLYIEDRSFSLKNHLGEAWTMRMDEFRSEYLVTRGEGQRFNVTCTLKVVGSLNDPIIVKEYNQPDYPLVVHNPTNIDIRDAVIFIRPTNKGINGISIINTDTNLVLNPGFEDVSGVRAVNSWDGSSDWESDIVLFYEGERCVRSFVKDSPIEQRIYCGEGEALGVSWSAMGDIAGEDKVRLSLTFLNKDGIVIGSFMDIRDVRDDWDEFYVTTPPTPAGTTYAELSFSKIKGDYTFDDCVYIDRVYVGIGDDLMHVRAHYPSPSHKVITFPDAINQGETLKLDFLTQTAHIDGKDVTSRLNGEFSSLTMGKSLLVFREHDYTPGDIEVVLRYNEVYV